MSEVGPFKPNAAQGRAASPTQPVSQTAIDPIVRWKPVATLKGDLMHTASELAFFWTGTATEAAQRGIYYRYERKDLPGAFKLSGTLAARRSSTLALIWAAETKGQDAHLVRLAELNLQLKELVEGLSTGGTDHATSAQLLALIEASRRKIDEVLGSSSRAP
jgi:hypothetical protein